MGNTLEVEKYQHIMPNNQRETFFIDQEVPCVVVLNAHFDSIQAKFNEHQIDELNQHYIMNVRAYCEKHVFKGAIKHVDNFHIDFKEA